MTPIIPSWEVAKLIDNAPVMQTIESGVPVRLLLDQLGKILPDTPLEQQFSELRKAIADRYLEGSVNLEKVEPKDSGRTFGRVQLDELDDVLSDPIIWISASQERSRPDVLLSKLPSAKRPAPFTWKAALSVLGIVVVATIITSVFGIGLIALAFFLQKYWHPLPVTYCGLMLVAGWWFLLALRSNPLSVKDMFFGSGGAMLGYMLAQILVVYPITFALFCREIYVTYYPNWFRGVASADRIEWVRFAYGFMLKSAMLDAPEIFEFELSSIHPSALAAKAVVFAYSCIVALVLIWAILEIIKIHRYPKAQLREYLLGIS
jgi:hypothetical protein